MVPKEKKATCFHIPNQSLSNSSISIETNDGLYDNIHDTDVLRSKEPMNISPDLHGVIGGPKEHPNCEKPTHLLTILGTEENKVK